MGRKERRAKERQERKESIRMTPDRICELKQKTANEAVRRVQEMDLEKVKDYQDSKKARDDVDKIAGNVGYGGQDNE